MPEMSNLRCNAKEKWFGMFLTTMVHHEIEQVPGLVLLIPRNVDYDFRHQAAHNNPTKLPPYLLPTTFMLRHIEMDTAPDTQ